ncbi:MAG TPA: hypothetical protein PLL30_15880 [Candidatus Krumholzibacteria bacterium]|nr:hypothetical protein [Candidatus Krumholzibacteria bacterium]HPD73250.1 hypothetical protein [Candidatus Krumholzibacteria bacterium]HRY40212.1 hypothetical protein [Candidatus Krumholzibacteria bacterium]
MKRVMIALLALTLACVMCSHALAQWPLENHYKVYNVSPPFTFAGNLVLVDQFGTYEPTALILTKFANPVAKNNEPIVFPENHHTWWSVDLVGSGWIVEVENQFGDQVWQVMNPRYLVLPALKNQPGTLPQHNHYLAYEAVGQPVNLPVHLADQFGIADLVAAEPVYFLNPVEKIAEGQVYPILDPQAHLACYRIIPPMIYDISLVAFDQFGEWGVVALDHDCLCVPSWKREVVRTEQRTWSELKSLFHR